MNLKYFFFSMAVRLHHRHRCDCCCWMKKNTMWLSCCVYSCDVIVLDSAIDPSIHSEAIGFQYNQFISFLSKIILFIENSFSHSYYFYFVSIIKFVFCTPLNEEKIVHSINIINKYWRHLLSFHIIIDRSILCFRSIDSTLKWENYWNF